MVVHTDDDGDIVGFGEGITVDGSVDGITVDGSVDGLVVDGE